MRPPSTVGGFGLGAFEREQKRNFTDVIYRCVAEHGISVIGEEINQGAETFASQLPESRPGTRYANVDMPTEVRRARGIPETFSMNREGHTAEELDRRDRIREEFMVDSLVANFNGNKYALLICGRLHQDRLAAILRQRGHEAVVVYIS